MLYLVLGTTVISSHLLSAEVSEKSEFALNSNENIRDGAYLDIGVGIGLQSYPFIYDGQEDSGLDLYINARYQKNGFFVEFPHGTSKQQFTILSMGYNFLNTDNWSYDLQLAMNHRDIEHEYKNIDQISNRVSHSKLGFRILGDFGDRNVKFIIAGASGDDDGGLYASAWLNQDYQYSNINYYFGVGIEYRNEDVVNYFFGTSEIVVVGIPQYRGKSGFEYTGQFGTSYPMSENWVLESFLRVSLLPNGISDSPLVDDNKVIDAAVLIKYVF